MDPEAESRAEATKALADFVSSELNSSTQRRASIDSRALALITANFALTTFFFAVKAQLGAPMHTLEGWVKGFTVAGAVISLISIGFALQSALPRKLLAADPDTLASLYTEIEQGAHRDVHLEILEAQIGLLEAGNKVNDAKAYQARRSLVGLAAVMLVYVLAACLQGG